MANLVEYHVVEHGLDLNRTGTSLLRKLDFEEPENVKLLLDASADPNAGMGAWGNTAFHQPILRGRSAEIIRLLIDRGADIDARTVEGKTPYALAKAHNRNAIAELLRERGAS